MTPLPARKQAMPRSGSATTHSAHADLRVRMRRVRGALRGARRRRDEHRACRECAAAGATRLMSAPARPPKLVKPAAATARRRRRTRAPTAAAQVAFKASASARGAPEASGDGREPRAERAASGSSRSTARPRLHACPLAETRTKVVFGAGNADADLMFVGEAPGAEEDRQGLPFVGRAGGAAQRAARGDRDDARGRLHRKRPQMPAARQPRSPAGRDRDLPPVPRRARSS